jgi:hypothetical protein
MNVEARIVFWNRFIGGLGSRFLEISLVHVVSHRVEHISELLPKPGQGTPEKSSREDFDVN